MKQLYLSSVIAAILGMIFIAAGVAVSYYVHSI